MSVSRRAVGNQRLAGTPLILLPGMDGTGDLFGPFLGVVPPHVACRVVRYPTDEVIPYEDLAAAVEQQMGDEPDVVLVAESFSGPLAVVVAARHPSRVRAVVLVASFVRPPAPRWLRHLIPALAFRVPPPAAVLRRLMTGRDAPDALVREVKASIRRVRPAVLASRLRDVLSIDCADALQRFPCALLYLRAADDRLVGASSAADLRVVRPDAVVTTLPGPHLLLQARPDTAWREIARFLATVPQGAARGSEIGGAGAPAVP